MAHSTLPVPPTPEFPQFYTGDLIDRLVRLTETAVTRAELSFCSGESSESSVGAADGGEPCRKRATVHDLSTGLDFCLEHFEGVICG